MRYDSESIKKRKEKVKGLKKIIDIILVILIYNIVLVTLSCMNKIEDSGIFGIKAYVISSNSMEPYLKSGDLIISRKQNEEYEAGDVITFYSDNEVITHRIIKIENGEITTKGDNNTIEDKNKINIDNVKGKMILKIPYFGKVMLFLENKTVFLIIILLILILRLFKLNRFEKITIRREKREIENEKNR